jgi:arabinose-5-phosphate isomerase
MNVPIIALTSNPASSLAVQSAVVLETGPIYEADPFSLIPSSSATVALVLGDAIAFTLLNVKGFQKEDYAVYHPGGSLGRRLMLRVRDVMITGKKIPCVPVSATLDDAIREINAKNLGFTIVLDRARRIAGIITDGDLRRLLARRTDLSGATLADCMTTNPRRIEEDKLAVQALAVMEKYEITCLVISTPDGKLKGIVHLHDLLGKRNFAQEF